MNIKISTPQGSKSLLIPLVDIVRVENCSLTFFNASAYNLYIIEKVHRGEEFFSLYSYRQKKDMLLAYNIITSLLRDKQSEPVMLQMEPMAG